MHSFSEHSLICFICCICKCWNMTRMQHSQSRKVLLFSHFYGQMKTLCYFMFHIANKAAAELTHPSPSACFPKQNVLGTYSPNCLQSSGTTEKQPTKRPHPSWLAHPRATLERQASVSAPANIITQLSAQMIKTWERSFKQCCGFFMGIAAFPRDPSWDQVPTAPITEAAMGNCLSCPGRLLTLEKKGKAWVIPCEMTPISQVKWWCVLYLLPKAVDFSGNYGVVKFCSRWNQVQKSDPRHFIKLPEATCCDSNQNRVQSCPFPHD